MSLYLGPGSIMQNVTVLDRPIRIFAQIQIIHENTFKHLNINRHFSHSDRYLSDIVPCTNDANWSNQYFILYEHHLTSPSSMY